MGDGWTDIGSYHITGHYGGPAELHSPLIEISIAEVPCKAAVWHNVIWQVLHHPCHFFLYKFEVISCIAE